MATKKFLLNRQKYILALIRRYGKPMGKTTLMKLLFLSSQRYKIGEHISFSRFHPYLYGPYSVEVDRDVTALTRSGLLETNPDGSVNLNPQAIDPLSLFGKKLPSEVMRKLNVLLKIYSPLSIEDLYKKTTLVLLLLKKPL